VDSIDFVSILLIAVGLSADCFAVALGVSTQVTERFSLQVLRVSLSFGLFQALMPILGWLAGTTIVEFIESFDHWVAFVLLAVVGGRMLWEALHSHSEQKKTDITKWHILLILSIATSIDALAVGLSFALLKVNITLAVLTIGLISLIVTAIGFGLGRKVGQMVGKRAEAVGGIILFVIGIRILLTHVL
jgi:putative Mn2+ efflux pump MntP